MNAAVEGSNDSCLKNLKTPKHGMYDSSCQSETSSHSESPSGAVEDNLILPEDYFLVEKIIGHKVVRGKNKYFVKWWGYPASYDTWEPEEGLSSCHGLISEYWNSRGNIGPPKAKKGKPQLSQQTMIKTEETSETKGNKEDKESIRILGATKLNGILVFLVRTPENGSFADIIPATEMNIKWPQVVIQFYENRIRFKMGMCERKNG